MSTAPTRKLIPAEYLAIERNAEFKSEFFDGEMFAMAGASPMHNRLKENLIIDIGAQLKGGPCHSYSGDQRVLVERTGFYVYPDIVIVCVQDAFDRLDKDTLTNPTVLIEVLSPSTEGYDRGVKFRHYQQLPSMNEYVLVSQDAMVVERFARQANGKWLLTTWTDPTAEFSLSSVEVRVPLSAIYAGVELPDATPPAQSATHHR